MNASSNYSNVDCDLDFPSAVAMATVNSVCSFIGIIGNLMVLLAVYKTKALRTLINAYLVILAIADLLTSAIAQPLLIAMIIQEARQECDTTITTVYRVVANFACTVSFLVLCSITTERFLAVVRPMIYRNCHQKRRFYIAAIVSLIVSLIYTILRVIGIKEGTSYFSIVIFVIRYIYILSCYLAILIQLRRHSNKMAESTSKGNTGIRRYQAEKSEKVVSTTMAIVIGTFTVMWVPLFYFRAAKPSRDTGVGYTWVSTTALSKSALYPIVYALRMEVYRNAFKHIVLRFHEPVVCSPETPAMQRTQCSSVGDVHHPAYTTSSLPK